LKTRPIDVVIVDDEPPARRKLLRLLETRAGIRVVGEAGSVSAAVAVVAEFQPGLLLLDVQLPDGAGFDVLSALPAEARPHTIFVTAFDHYAVKAFEVRALDYLMKPVSQSRLDVALDRARDAIGRDISTRYLRRFLVRSGSIAYLVEADSVDWMESARNYLVLHAGGATHIVRGTLDGLAAQLDPDRFVRISRSAVVNIIRLESFGRASNGDPVVSLSGGRSLRCGKRYMDAALARLTGVGQRHALLRD